MDSVKLAAVKDILDRAGYKPEDRVEQTNYEAEEVESLECLTDEELAAFIRIKRKIAESVETPVSTPESAEKN
jgi:hypothetical protein